jgi:hypothetical protein
VTTGNPDQHAACLFTTADTTLLDNGDMHILAIAVN